jgi:hypothetical protein
VPFDVADFDEVAALMRPRRRRQLTEAQRRACAERLARVRAQRLEKWTVPRSCIPEGQGDLLDLSAAGIAYASGGNTAT